MLENQHKQGKHNWYLSMLLKISEIEERPSQLGKYSLDEVFSFYLRYQKMATDAKSTANPVVMGFFLINRLSYPITNPHILTILSS